jgi:hypothetical protein
LLAFVLQNVKVLVFSTTTKGHLFLGFEIDADPSSNGIHANTSSGDLCSFICDDASAIFLSSLLVDIVAMTQ